MLGCTRGEIGPKLGYGRGTFWAIAGVVTEEELEFEGVGGKG